MGTEGNAAALRFGSSHRAGASRKPADNHGHFLSQAIPGLDEKTLSPAWLESHPVTSVRIDSLVFEGSPRRDGEDTEHIRLLSEATGPLPPITVHGPTMRVIDGVHRVRAALLNNLSRIEARLLNCDENTAFVLAVKANITHGLPLSQDDRAAAALQIITNHPHWSDRAVAAATGLSDKTISRIRGRSAAQEPQPAVRLGRDGRLRPLDSGAKRQHAAALISEKPHAGLRELARATGLSVATVRDVRQRIDRGEDPVPDRYRTAGRPGLAEQAGPAAAQPAAEPPGPAAPPCSSLQASRTRYKEQPADRQVLLAKLGHDPSLRFSEAGRHVLHWLHRHTVDANGLEGLSHGLPDHWAPVVAALARGCATAWTRMAEELEQREAG